MKTIPSLLMGFSVGFTVGYIVKSGLNGKILSPERALIEVKSTLKKNGIDIDGAWIYSQAEEWSKDKISQSVYYGGITENHDDEAVHYDFVADAKTGTILEFSEQK